MFHSTIAVFKQVVIDNQIMFAWFRAGDEEEQKEGNFLVAQEYISEDELWARLEFD